MLTNKIKVATDSISYKTKLQTQKLSNERLTARLASINSIGKELEACFETIQAMQKNRISYGTPINEEQKTSLLEAINKCGQCISDLSIDDTIVSVFKMQTDVIKQLLSAHWKQSANSYSEEAVSYLTILSDLTPDPKHSNDLLKSIKAQAATTTPNQSTIIKFSNDVSAAQKIVNQYKLEPIVQDFLFKVKLKTATIEDLNSDVITWLKENNLTKKLLISF